MKRIHYKVLSLIGLILVFSPFIALNLYPEFSTFLTNNPTIDTILLTLVCIIGLPVGFIMDSWWKKSNPTLGY